jgi:hypothetical protein
LNGGSGQQAAGIRQQVEPIDGDPAARCPLPVAFVA